MNTKSSSRTRRRQRWLSSFSLDVAHLRHSRIASFIASASAEPRIEGQVSQEDVRGITAIRAATNEPSIVVIRSSSQAGSAGVQTASGPTAGCQYFVRRIADTWKIMGKSCWTHVITPQDASERWPRVARPSENVRIRFHGDQTRRGEPDTMTFAVSKLFLVARCRSRFTPHLRTSLPRAISHCRRLARIGRSRRKISGFIEIRLTNRCS